MDTVESELESLFQWSPPHLSLSPDASKSKHSRPPSFYDKHLDDSLILKEVKLLSSLRDDIAKVVDKTLASLDRRGVRLPPPGRYFATAEDRAENEFRLTSEMKNERSVSNFYSGTTAKYCVNVASTLALHPTATMPPWTSIIEWHDVTSLSNYAIADGIIRINRSLVPVFLRETGVPAPIMEKVDRLNLDPDLFDKLAEVAKRFPDIMTWEIKRLSVAPEGVMEAVMDLVHGAQFPWVKCRNRVCDRHDVTFGMRDVTFDATSTPWTIPSDGTDILYTGGRRSSRLTTADGPSSSHESTGVQSKGKRKRDENDEDDGGGDDGDDDYGDDDEERNNSGGDNGKIKTAQGLTAEKYLQQAWAKAVRNDATLICLHAGSLEYIGVRHRTTQRLYLSDLIRTHDCDPGYGKLHTGLYIAALEDAMDRALQLAEEDKKNEGSGLVAGGSGSGHSGDVHDAGGGDPKGGSGDNPKGGSRGGKAKRGSRGGGGRNKRRKGPGGGGRGETKRKESADQHQLLHETTFQNIALVYLRYGIYNSPVPAMFTRRAFPVTKPTPPPSPPRFYNKDHPLPDGYMTLIVTSEIATGATGIVHGATLKVHSSNGSTLSDEVVVKLALLDEQKVRLRNEHAIYQNLASKRVKGLPTVLGLFDDMEEGPTLIIMTHAGTSLDHGPPISPSQRAAFLYILSGIHEAGILHCDLRPQNLLVDEFGEATIIDFDQSKSHPLKEDTEHEYAELVRILDDLGVKA